MELFLVLSSLWILAGTIVLAMVENSGVLVVREADPTVRSRAGCREVLTCTGFNPRFYWVKKGSFSDQLGYEEVRSS